MEREFAEIINGLNKIDFEAKFGVGVEDVFGDVLEKFKRLGLIIDDGKVIKLTYKGKLFTAAILRKFYTRSLFEEFLSKFEENKTLKMFSLLKKEKIPCTPFTKYIRKI